MWTKPFYLGQAVNDLQSGEPVGGGSLVIREMEVQLPDGTVHHLSQIKSLDGMATSTVIPREAMGMGDVHLLGMIGAFFGWTGVFFSLFAASVFAIIAAVIGRVGFGRQLPFGPFLAMVAVAWMYTRRSSGAACKSASSASASGPSSRCSTGF